MNTLVLVLILVRIDPDDVSQICFGLKLLASYCSSTV